MRAQTVVIVAGDAGRRAALAGRFREQGCRVLCTGTALQALAICAAAADVTSVVVDSALEGITAPQLENVLRRALPGIGVVVAPECGRKPVRRIQQPSARAAV